MKTSIVVPLYNESQSVKVLHQRLMEVLESMGDKFELIFVDDGSKDDTFKVIKILPRVRAIRLRRNFGQTAALATGIEIARGDIVITIDGDLENDPSDIPKLLDKISEGYDVVSGWRRGRWQDKPFSRRLPSFLANSLISWVTDTKLHDHGCTLKAYKKSAFSGFSLSGEMHRMIAAYAAKEGALVTEIEVNFKKRLYGKSNYGISRTLRVLLDILAFHFRYKYGTRPMHFFGVVGFWMFILGGLVFGWMLVLKFFKNTSFIQTPLPVLVVFFAIMGVLLILMGLLAEMIYRLSRNKDAGLIGEEVINY